MSDLLFCDDRDCEDPILLVGFHTELDGSYCRKHLYERLVDAGVIGNE